MQPSRLARRYHASLPIHLIKDDGTEAKTCCTNSISASGCVLCSPPPEWAEVDESCEVRIPRDQKNDFIVGRATVTEGPHGEAQLAWELDPAKTRELISFVEEASTEPSSEAKADYLANENRLLHTEIASLNEQRRQGYQFLFILVGAYFTYTVAPYRLFQGQLAVEMMLFYALAGVWISVMLVFHCLRFLDFLAISVRRRAHLYKAMSGNRGWLFANDPIYHKKTVLPLSNRYSDLKAFSSTDDGAGEEHSEWLAYNSSATIFLFFLQVLFVVGFVYFSSLLIRGYDIRIVDGLRLVPEMPGVRVEGEPQPLDLFKIWDFQVALAGWGGLVLIWVQVMSNKCLKMQKRIWEARRISEIRPNPRFPEGILSDREVRGHRFAKWLVGGIIGYGLVGLTLFFHSVRTADNLFVDGLASWLLITVLCVGLVITKVFYGILVIDEATKADRNAMPLRKKEYERELAKEQAVSARDGAEPQSTEKQETRRPENLGDDRE